MWKRNLEGSIINLVSGVRLKKDGLHLGHYLGCLSPLSTINEEYRYFFVIDDLSPASSLIAPQSNRNLISIASDALATGYGEKIIFLLKSHLVSRSPLLHNILRELMTLRQIKSIHPKRKIIREQKDALTLADFTFILYEVLTHLALDADYVIMNDDNKRFVDYSRKIARKFNNKYSACLSEPILLHGPLPRLLGYNLEKMAKSNNNCIYLSDDAETIKKKVDQIVKYKETVSIFVDSDGLFISPKDVNLSNNYLPFTYFRLFGEEKKYAKILQNFRNGSLSLNKLSEELARTINEFLQPMRSLQNYYRNNPDKIWERISIDTEMAIRFVERTDRKVKDVIKAKLNEN